MTHCIINVHSNAKLSHHHSIPTHWLRDHKKSAVKNMTKEIKIMFNFIANAICGPGELLFQFDWQNTILIYLQICLKYVVVVLAGWCSNSNGQLSFSLTKMKQNQVTFLLETTKTFFFVFVKEIRSYGNINGHSCSAHGFNATDHLWIIRSYNNNKIASIAGTSKEKKSIVHIQKAVKSICMESDRAFLYMRTISKWKCFWRIFFPSNIL